jgi:GR25 family glycosyltransferase involved in LPS biosynthesis
MTLFLNKNKFSFKKLTLAVFGLLFLALLVFTLFIKCKYFYHKLPTKSIKMEDIKSVQIINLDRAKNRKAKYEKMLRDNLGNTFMERKIGNDIRLSAVDGKKEVIFENLTNGKKYKYNDIKDKEELFLKDRQFKIYSEKDPENYWYFSFTKSEWNYKSIFNIFGCGLSHWKAIRRIAQQPQGTYGIIFEDDFFVEKDFYKKLQNVLSEVPDDFDVLKISLTQSQIFAGYKKLPLKKYIRFVKKMFHEYGYSSWLDLSIPGHGIAGLYVGCQGYIVSAEGARKIIEYTKKHFMKSTGCDNDVFYFLPKDKVIKSYIYLKEVPVLLSQIASISQLDNSQGYNTGQI